MGFAEDMKKLAERLASIESQVTTEEATKMSLILPFFQLLGYDVFNPSEFCPEFTADVGIKKGEKVDYAILRSGQPVILIEAKAVRKEKNSIKNIWMLKKYWTQRLSSNTTLFSKNQSASRWTAPPMTL